MTERSVKIMVKKNRIKIFYQF